MNHERIGADSVIPPALYLPIRMTPEGYQIPEVRQLADGRQALIAFTALDRLADSCGAEQPWTLVVLDGLAEIKDAHPFDVVSFDPTFAPQLIQDGRLA